MRSIRAYLLSRLLGGSALILAAAGVGIYLLIAGSLIEQFDRNLSDRVQAFASILFQVGEQVAFEFSGELMPEYEREFDPDYFEVRFEDGRLLERSESLHGADLALPDSPSTRPLHWDAPLPDGRAGRYVAQLLEVHHVYPEEGPDRPQAARVLVVVAQGREPLVEVERRALLLCISLSLTLIGLIAFLSWRTVERSLEPAGRLAQAVERIRVDDLPRSLGAGRLPAELEPVAAMIDALIARVGTALERERRTAADIAHELRTPISEILTVSEVAMSNGHDAGEARAALQTVRDIAWRMGGSTSSLLKLARLEMGSETSEREQIDLGEIVASELRSLSAASRERELVVACDIAPGQLVEGDREALRIVISNLLSNAMHHSPAGGSIRCRLERDADGWSLVVENETAELRPEDLRALTQPFWRKDRARTDQDRTGLGLALSLALAERTGMTLSFGLEGSTFRALLGGGCGPATRAGTDAATGPWVESSQDG